MTSVWSYTDIAGELATDTPSESNSLLLALELARDNGVAITFSYGELKNIGFLTIRGRKAGHSCQRAIAGPGVEDILAIAGGVVNVVKRVVEHLKVSVKDQMKSGGKFSAPRIRETPQ